jgi:hypothetical protein
MTGFAKNTMRRFALAVAVSTVAQIANDGTAQQLSAASNLPDVAYAVQGWSAADRDIFYTTSQGSHMMPYAFFKALRCLDIDQPFAADQLQRYGYLPNAVSASNPEGLPVGFVIDDSTSPEQLGMTCAACHTAQMEYQKDGVTRAMRLDGAPSNADFQRFLTDLLAASRASTPRSMRRPSQAPRAPVADSLPTSSLSNSTTALTCPDASSPAAACTSADTQACEQARSSSRPELMNSSRAPASAGGARS